MWLTGSPRCISFPGIERESKENLSTGESSLSQCCSLSAHRDCVKPTGLGKLNFQLKHYTFIMLSIYFLDFAFLVVIFSLLETVHRQLDQVWHFAFMRFHQCKPNLITIWSLYFLSSFCILVLDPFPSS